MNAITKAKPSLRPFQIMRDFWDAEGVRHPAGGIAEFDPSDDLTLDMLEQGIISRVK